MISAIAVIMTFLVLALIGIPLFREKKPEDDLVPEEDYEDPDLDRLLSRKETALEAIRELEFDHAVGSLSDDDYQELKEKYEMKAISILKKLKEMDEVGASSRWRESGKKARRAQPNHAIRQSACPECGAPYRPEARFCASCGVELDVFEDFRLTCPECGEQYEEEDAFCASCGTRLEPNEEEFAASGEYAAGGFGDEWSDEVIQPANRTSTPQRKRRGQRLSDSKKATGDNDKGPR